MAKTDKDILDKAGLDEAGLDDTGLEAFFDAGRAGGTPTPSDDLIAAILADAAAQMPAPARHAPSAPRPFWKELMAQIGGWPAVAGMATATCASVWIGFAAPDQLETWSGGVILAGDYATTETIYTPEDLTPGYLGTDLLVEEETGA